MKNNIMKRYYFLIGLAMFFLLFTSIKADIMNLTGVTEIQIPFNGSLTGGQGTAFNHLTLEYSSLWDKWYLLYVRGSATSDQSFITSFDTNFVKETGTYPYLWGNGSQNFMENLDFVIFPDSMELYGFGGVNAQHYFKSINPDPTPLGKTVINTTDNAIKYGGPELDWIDITNDGTAIFVSSWTGDTIYFKRWFETKLPNDLPILQTLSGVTHNEPRIVYTPTAQEYWLVYRDTNDIIYINRYNAIGESFDYKTRHALTTSATNTNESFDAILWNDLIYIVYERWGNDTVEIKLIDPESTALSNSIVTIDTQTINLGAYGDLDVGINNSQMVGITHDDNWLMLYYWIRNETMDLGIYGLQEAQYCICGTWLNTTECAGDYRKQIRNCYPYYCDATIQYILAENYCAFGGAGGSYQTKQECFSLMAMSDWKDSLTGSRAICDLNANFPENTTSVWADATITPEVKFNDFWDEIYNIDRTYKLKVCNPITDCTNEDFDCDDEYRNVSYNKTYVYTDLTDRFIDMSAEITYTHNCRESSWPFFYGWDEYRITCTLTYCYNVTCSGRYVCIGDGDLKYSVPELRDCTRNYTARTLCNFGCNPKTGRCYDGTNGTGEGSLDVFSYFLGSVDDVFPSNILMIISIGLIGMVMVGSYQVSGKGHSGGGSWELALGSGLLMSILFFSLGWFPFEWVLLWIISVALLLTVKVGGVFKK